MQTLEHEDQYAADLYWLAFLLTGNRQISIDVTVGALDFQGGPNPFFSTWMRGWSRKVVISKALAAIREELAASAGRLKEKRRVKHRRAAQDWVLSPHTTKVQLERALLAIDTLPRCAVLLSVFEGLSMDDTAILLDSDRESIRRARISGMQQLASNFEAMQGGTSKAGDAPGLLGEVQHA